MASRQPVELRLPQLTTRPTAAPVDSYVRPGQTASSQLATALAEVAPQVGRFSSVLAQRIAEEERAKGERAARAEGEKALAAGELTRAGQLPMQANPWFMAAYDEEWGRVAAGVMASDFDREVLPKLKDSTDIADFDRAFGEFAQQWPKTKNFDRNSKHFEKAYGTAQDAYFARARMAFGKQIEENLDKKSDELVFSSTRRIIDDNKGVPIDITGFEIEDKIQTFVALGRPEGKVRSQVAAAIGASAQQAATEGNFERAKYLLGLLDRVSGEGGQGVLRQQSYGQQVSLETATKIRELEHTTLVRQRQEEQYQREQRKEEINKAAAIDFAKNPGRNALSWAKEKFPNDLDLAVEVARQVKASATDAAYAGSEPTFRDLYLRIWYQDPGEKKTTWEEVNAKAGLLSQNQMAELRAALMQDDERARKGGGEDEEKLKLMDQVQVARIKDGFPVITKGALHPDGDLVGRALTDYYDARSRLLASGKVAKMSDQEIEQWATTVADAALARYRTANHRRAINAQPPAPTYADPNGKWWATPEYTGLAPSTINTTPIQGQQQAAPSAPSAAPKPAQSAPAAKQEQVEVFISDETFERAAYGDTSTLKEIARAVLPPNATEAQIAQWVAQQLDAYEKRLLQEAQGGSP